ncbi:unnamed protein product, partial [marine sediment metagenome]
DSKDVVVVQVGIPGFIGAFLGHSVASGVGGITGIVLPLIGDPLSRSVAEDSRLIWPGTSGRVRFKMTPYVLEPETMYILVVRQSPSFLEFPDEWQYDAGDATYPRGYRVAQEGTDEPWDTHLDDDHIFAIKGE